MYLFFIKRNTTSCKFNDYYFDNKKNVSLQRSIENTVPMHLKRAILTFVSATVLTIPARAQWKYEIPFPKPLQAESDTVTISFIGDVMMHARQLEFDCAPFLSRIGGITEGADISVANLEYTLAGEPYTGYPCFSAPDSYASYAADRGIDVFLTANNHILDKGDKGLLRTLEVYEGLRRTRGIQYTGTASGAASDTLLNPLMVVGKGIRIALVNFTYGTNNSSPSAFPKVNRMKKENVKALIDRAKAKGADFIIALPHWGNEYQLHHSGTQQDWAEWLAKEGADLIVGAHPHVVQDTSHIHGTPVIYSLGNAVSNMSATNTRLELAATARLVKHSDGRKEVLEPELTFLWCTLPGTLTDSYCTIPVKEYIGRRSEWKSPADYDNMITTYKRVIKETGINEEDN